MSCIYDLGDYPAGVTNNHEHFNLPNGSPRGTSKPLPPPQFTMVWCIECQKHWRAPVTEMWWKARIELCPEHASTGV